MWFALFWGLGTVVGGGGMSHIMCYDILCVVTCVDMLCVVTGDILCVLTYYVGMLCVT